jgi:short-subunit dehydrogenase
MTEHSFKKKYGDWGLVAGAAEGLGEAYTVALAKRGINVLMIDKQKPSLTSLSERIERNYGVKTSCLHLDLIEGDAVDKIMEVIDHVECRLFIYNAAYSLVKPFMHHSLEELDRFIDINNRNQIKLVHQFSQHLIRKKQTGGMVLMSSLSGLIGMQLVAPYAATKAFTWNLAEALHHELSPYGIDIMACIAGATATPAYLNTGPEYGFPKPSVLKPEKVAEYALKKLGKKTMCIPGFSNRFSYFILTRLMPRKLAAAIANKTMGAMYKHKFET